MDPTASCSPKFPVVVQSWEGPNHSPFPCFYTFLFSYGSKTLANSTLACKSAFPSFRYYTQVKFLAYLILSTHCSCNFRCTNHSSIKWSFSVPRACAPFSESGQIRDVMLITSLFTAPSFLRRADVKCATLHMCCSTRPFFWCFSPLQGILSLIGRKCQNLSGDSWDISKAIISYTWQCVSQSYPWLHQKKGDQQVEGGDYPHLLYSETPPAALHSSLEPRTQERHGPAWVDSEGHKDDQRTRPSLLQRQAEKVRVVQLWNNPVQQTSFY